MADERIELTDLDVIARYSLAVRAATADRDELIATLRSDLEWLEGLRPAGRRTTAATAPKPAPAKPVAAKPVAAKPVAAKPAPARKAAAKKAVSKQTAAKKAARR